MNRYLCVVYSAVWAEEPIPLKPLKFRTESQTSAIKRAKAGAGDRAQVGDPSAIIDRLDMRRTCDCRFSESGQLNGLVVQAADLSARSDDELHGSSNPYSVFSGIIEMYGVP
jgi:hypothetical protein